MTILIKSYLDVPPYIPINISVVEKAIDKMVENSISKTGIKQDIIELSDVSKALGSSEFLKTYTDVLANMFKELPSDYFAGSDFFDPYGDPAPRVTRVREEHLAEDLDEAISTIRGLIKVAFPNGHTGLDYIVNIKDPQQFLNAFANIMSDIGGGAALGGLQNHVRGMATKYGQLLKGDMSVLESFNTNLQNVTGQVLWENISLIARKKALEIYFNELHPEITNGFVASGGKVIAKGIQRGRALSSKGQQEVADSLVVLSFREEGDKEVLAVTLADSTKLTQNAMKNQSFYIHSTKTQAKTYDIKYLLNSVDKLGYWEKRLQPYLGGAYEKVSDAKNWDNTRQAFYLLALYDVLAVRATTSGTYAQTLTVNGKIQMINDIIKNVSNYYQYRSSGSYGSIRGQQNNIFNMGYIKHSSYIKKQQSASRGGTQEDESILENNYQKYINSILQAKINIGTNVLF